jgi:hypothetical protein
LTSELGAYGSIVWPWLAAIASLLVLDRILLWMESQGWIYYRRRRASPGTFGSALMQIHGLLEPDKQHLVEVEQHAKQASRDDGSGPDDSRHSRGDD